MDNPLSPYLNSGFPRTQEQGGEPVPRLLGEEGEGARDPRVRPRVLMGRHVPFLNSISRTSGTLGALAGSWVFVYRPGGAWF